MKKISLSAVSGALIAVGMIVQVSASAPYTSAGSKIEFKNIIVNVSGVSHVSVLNFSFVTSNAANLNGDSGFDTNNCVGYGFGDNCNAVPPRLDSNIIIKGRHAHDPNNFDLDDRGTGDEYSYADSVLQTIQASGDPVTEFALIAQTELTSVGTGNSSSTIQTSTGITMDFIVVGSGEVVLSFEADPAAYSESDNPYALSTTAESSIAVNLLLSQNTGGTGEAVWAPNGALDGCVSLEGGLYCSGETDDENLNRKSGVNADPAVNHYSMGTVWSDYGITISGLTSGDWTLTLTSTVANSVTMLSAVPPPPINLPPDCTTATVDNATLWPPNHNFVPVGIRGVTDPDGDPVVITIDSIFQDEPVDGRGDGRFFPDGMGVGTDTASLRAERSGSKKVPGNGRVYHIDYTADDGRGGVCSGHVAIAVPHDKEAAAIDDGALFDSTVPEIRYLSMV